MILLPQKDQVFIPSNYHFLIIFEKNKKNER